MSETTTAGRAEGGAPGPGELWAQAGGGTPAWDRARFHRLMREHGYLLDPGDEGYDEAPANLPCGWPHRPERTT